jgi:hypothetical protein
VSRFQSWKQPIQITKQFSQDDEPYITRANANDLKQFFGLRYHENWAADGHAKLVIKGVTVWVNPLGKILDPVAPYWRKNIREGMHTRLMCLCPDCGKQLTYGRLHQHMKVHHIPTNFERFTKRTNKPKLNWLICQLDKAGIDNRLNGESFHAPILDVDESRFDDAMDILGPVDDVADDDEQFQGYIW